MGRIVRVRGRMQKIVKLFNDARFEEFLRIIISDNNLTLVHINHEKIERKIETELIDKIKIFEYIKEHVIHPLEVIISSNTMSCRSISLNNLREKDVIALANNVLTGKNGSVNLACYEKKFSYKRGSASFCDMKLTPIISLILKETLELGNPISATVAWPFWIVENYFKLHPSDREKFKAPIFVVKTKSGSEIIGLHNGKHVYYRRGCSDGFNEEVETNNAIKFITQLFNANLEDVVIYSLNDETIDTFTFNSNLDMQLVSKSGNLVAANRAVNLDLVLKSACSLIFIGLFINTIMDVAKIFNYSFREKQAEKSINAVDPEIVNELAMWGSLDNYVPVKHLDLKSELTKKTKGTNKKLQNASLKIDEKTKQSTLNTIYEEEE